MRIKRGSSVGQGLGRDLAVACSVYRENNEKILIFSSTRDPRNSVGVTCNGICVGTPIIKGEMVWSGRRLVTNITFKVMGRGFYQVVTKVYESFSPLVRERGMVSLAVMLFNKCRNFPRQRLCFLRTGSHRSHSLIMFFVRGQ